MRASPRITESASQVILVVSRRSRVGYRRSHTVASASTYFSAYATEDIWQRATRQAFVFQVGASAASSPPVVMYDVVSGGELTRSRSPFARHRSLHCRRRMRRMLIDSICFRRVSLYSEQIGITSLAQRAQLIAYNANTAQFRARLLRQRSA